MSNTVVIFNAGIGISAVAFQNAGFKILASYEAEEDALKEYKRNIGENIYQGALESIEEAQIPDADVYATSIFKPFSKTIRCDVEQEELYSFSRILTYKRPKAFCILANRALLTSDEFECFVKEQGEYSISYGVYDVQEVTGFPVRERQFYVIGILSHINDSIRLSNEYYGETLKPELFFEDNRDVDLKYYWKIPKGPKNYTGDENVFLCWKTDGYEVTTVVDWNYLKLPLVCSDNRVRKLTHREISRLKGVSDDFYLNTSNKAWLYKKLMYAPNVYALQKLIKSIEMLLGQDTYINSQIINASRFEDMFWRYLEHVNERAEGISEGIVREVEYCERRFDFGYLRQGKDVYFELKFFSSNNEMKQKLIKICERLFIEQNNGEAELVLVIPNVVSLETKKLCKEKFAIHVWDVANILWVFKEVPEVLNEFIALLSYSVINITPREPEYNLFERVDIKLSEHDLKTKLAKIKPGRENFSTYESTCIEILQYVFGEYLTLWRKQQESNQDLYRFDLYCKIKHDVQEEFFDTIRTYFGTKYIVFEFKNYKDQITQQEIYTTEKYLYEKALRKVAIIISRKGPDKNAQIAARGCLRENGKLILFLSDDDLYDLIDIKNSKNQTTASLLEDKLDDTLVVLEK